MSEPKVIVIEHAKPAAVVLRAGIPGPPGPTGPVGPKGESGDLHFTFKQETPSAKWDILHGLAKYPSVTVTDSANDEIEGDIEYLSPNELVLIFSAPFSGMALLN